MGARRVLGVEPVLGECGVMVGVEVADAGQVTGEGHAPVFC
ncbi:hypothetical protein ABZY45_25785 [Streptomyces sp. NPDC006516]